MKHFLRRHLLLLLSVLLFSVSAFFWLGYNTEDIPYRDQQEVKAIAIKINKHLDALNKQVSKVTKLVNENERVTFSSLNEEYEYPCFVYCNKKLIYWSDFRFVPEYESIYSDSILKYVSLQTGKYLVNKKSFKKGKDEYDVFGMLQLYYQYPIRNNYIASGHNRDLFGITTVRINNTSLGPNSDVRSTDGDFLFSLDFSSHTNESSRRFLLWGIIVSFILAVVLLVSYVIRFLDKISRIQSVDISLLFLIFLFMLIRWVMLYFSFPYSLIEFELFDPRKFASSSISPSLGDLFFNIICFTIVTWNIYKNYYRLEVVRWMITTKEKLQSSVISVIIVVFAYFSLYLIYYILFIVYSNSQWVIDITNNLEFDVFKIFCLVIFVLCCFCFFIWTHMFYRIYLELNPKMNSKSFLLLSLSFLLCLLIGYFSDTWNLFVFCCFVLYTMIVINFSLPNILSKLKYDTYLYFLSCSMVCALMGAYALYDFYKSINNINKEKFASQVLVDNDLYGEYLLNNVSEKITEDEFFKNTLVNPFASKQLISRKIEKIYLPGYFDKYDLDIEVYDAAGLPYLAEQPVFSSYREATGKFRKNEYKTDYPSVFFVKESKQNISKSYILFNDIVRDQDTLGYILIHLKHKRIVPTNVYPELLVDRRQFAPPVQGQSYFYAIYSDEHLMYALGGYNYDKRFKSEWLKDDVVFTKGIEDNEYHHLGIKSNDDKVVIVSSLKYSFNNFFSNFSFLFLILISFVALFLAYAVYFRFDQIVFTYATKIQIYLNIAFFLPLIIVSITTLSIISNTYTDNLNKSFIKKADDMSQNLAAYMEDQRKTYMHKDKIEDELLEMARYTQSDINIFNRGGILTFSSQPAIYDNDLLSRFVNPVAFGSIIEQRSGPVMLNESVGKLNYNTVYAPIRSYQTGKMLGIISIPFFESKVEMDKQIIEVLTTILNIFTSTFIVFLVLSYFVSHLLTEPLKIITQKIRKTTLGENEPIEWKSNDEIGLLVGEYNEMLLKLEQSRLALTRSEKESAWREMAKQVAHEIKNPLTPMKLAIQHLQRSIKDKSKNTEELTDKTLHTLLDQVNNLSEIATSFSSFAKMPIPKSELFNLSRTLNNTFNLYTNRPDLSVTLSMDRSDVMVDGDEQVMGGILTNLILNGIQSVPSSVKPEIHLKLTTYPDKVSIEVKDNGSGIPENIRDKVFLPNFSTKYSGSGIGLAVAKRGVEHAGGRIWFETSETSGTSFFIELPLMQ